jgi:hypothetical protein
MKVVDELKQIPPHTLITGIAAIAWLASFGLRAMFPGFALGPAADTLMATCVAWWMKANKQKNPDGLMNEVMEKIALPYISTAHSPDRTPVTTPVGTPAPKPPAPKPTTAVTPTQPTTKPTGGLPWEQ